MRPPQPPQQQPDLSQQQPGIPGQLQQPGMPPQQQPQLGSMQDPMLAQQQQTQQTNLGFGQQPPFNEPSLQQFNDMNAMNQQQQNKLIDPMLGPMDQPLRDPVTGQQLHDPMTGQPLFGQQPKQPGGLMDPMGQQPQQQMMNKPPEQQFDPMTGMPLSQQQMEMNKANQQMIGPPFDQMNQINANLGQPGLDPMLGLKQPFGEINNNLLIGDKMKQQQQPSAQFPLGGPPMPGQPPLMDQLSMQNAQLYALENGRLPRSFAFSAPSDRTRAFPMLPLSQRDRKLRS